MRHNEALNAAGVCDQSDRFNCKYCRRAGRDCDGVARGAGGVFPTRIKCPRVSMAAGINSPLAALYDLFDRIEGELRRARAASRAAYEPRHLVREELIEWDEPPHYVENGVAVELPGPMIHVRAWRFHYSDGEFEQVTSRSPTV